MRLIFFFQAEDGIRDYKVTGVQTCALPISVEGRVDRHLALRDRGRRPQPVPRPRPVRRLRDRLPLRAGGELPGAGQIGRASCRERVKKSEGAEEEKEQIKGT